MHSVSPFIAGFAGIALAAPQPLAPQRNLTIPQFNVSQLNASQFNVSQFNVSQFNVSPFNMSQFNVSHFNSSAFNTTAAAVDSSAPALCRGARTFDFRIAFTVCGRRTNCMATIDGPNNDIENVKWIRCSELGVAFNWVSELPVRPFFQGTQWDGQYRGGQDDGFGFQGMGGDFNPNDAYDEPLEIDTDQIFGPGLGMMNQQVQQGRDAQRGQSGVDGHLRSSQGQQRQGDPTECDGEDCADDEDEQGCSDCQESQPRSTAERPTRWTFTFSGRPVRYFGRPGQWPGEEGGEWIQRPRQYNSGGQFNSGEDN